MKRAILLLLAGGCLLGCDSSVDASKAFNVVGVYQLVLYKTSTALDESPSGTIRATQVDHQHVNLVIKGVSGKVKLNYAYQNVFIMDSDTLHSEAATYVLVYKGRPIGLAGMDGISRYLLVNPAPGVSIQGDEL